MQGWQQAPAPAVCAGQPGSTASRMPGSPVPRCGGHSCACELPSSDHGPRNMTLAEPRIPNLAVVQPMWEHASSLHSSIRSQVLRPSLTGHPEALRRGVNKSLLYPHTPSLLCGFFSAVSNSCSAAFTVPKSCKVKSAHINAFHSYFLGPETVTHCQGCNSQSVLRRSQAAGRDMTHHVPQQWTSIRCCSITRGFSKNCPILQQHVAACWGLALV